LAAFQQTYTLSHEHMFTCIYVYMSGEGKLNASVHSSVIYTTILLHVRSGQVRVRVTLRLTVSQSVCLGVEPNLGQLTRVYFLLEISFRQLQVCNFVATSLTRGRVCKLLYNFVWALPEQSLLGWIPSELTALFYCLIWDSTNLEGQVPEFRSR
jgi:hypothetical protein